LCLKAQNHTTSWVDNMSRKKVTKGNKLPRKKVTSRQYKTAKLIKLPPDSAP
jgi:hypothetical protein